MLRPSLDPQYNSLGSFSPHPFVVKKILFSRNHCSHASTRNFIGGFPYHFHTFLVDLKAPLRSVLPANKRHSNSLFLQLPTFLSDIQNGKSTRRGSKLWNSINLNRENSSKSRRIGQTHITTATAVDPQRGGASNCPLPQSK